MSTPGRDPITLAREVLETAHEDDTITVCTIPDNQAAALARAVIELTGKLESGEASDGYHTHNELYEYRVLYHAHAVRHWLACGYPVTKSWNHADGEPCFGGGWFIVTAQLPAGQVSNHYATKDWPLFEVPEVERPAEWDGHTPQEAAARIHAALNGEHHD